MKRILLAMTILIFVLPTVRRAEAAEVSVDFFYNNLNDGNWIEVGDYGYGWQPNAASNRNWRPYADGYWAYTDVGWTWVSYEDFGWATYHYGRWARIADQGWVWFPGNDLEWGPAWVSWRTGGDYIGWAPLPPRGGQVVYEGRPITGHVDVEFDIGPAYYNFVDVRYIGEPVLRERLFESSQNVTYINKTVNVTNITYNNSVVYNYGPDYETVNRYSTRPIQRLQIERQSNVDVSVALRSGGITKVAGAKLVVAAPMKIERTATPIAPKVVKTKVEQSKIEHGWQGLGDPKAQAQLKQKMQTEDTKNVTPPTVQPRAGAGANASTGGNGSTGASASPVPSAPASVAAGTTAAASASPAMSPIEKGKGKRKGVESNVSPSPSASVAGGAAPMERRKGKQKEQNAPSVTPNATSPAGSTSNVSSETNTGETGHGKRKAERSDLNAPASTTETTAAPNAVTAPQQHRKAEQGPSENATGGQSQGEKGKAKKKEEVSPTPGPQ
jgi:hypothetical protein